MTQHQTHAQPTDETTADPTIVALPDEAKAIIHATFGADTRLTDLTTHEDANGRQLLTESGTNWVQIEATSDGLLAEQVDAGTVDEDDLSEVTRTDPATQPDLSDVSTETRRRGD